MTETPARPDAQTSTALALQDVRQTSEQTATPAEDRPLAAIFSIQGFVDTPDGRKLFASTDSLRWFVRTHQRALVEAGAIAKMGRRVMICRPEFDREAVRIIKARARASLAE